MQDRWQIPMIHIDSTGTSVCSTGNKVVVQVENVWKQYRLGSINHGTLVRDLQSWWARVRGRHDPNSAIDQTDQSPKSLSSKDRLPSGAAQADFWALQDLYFDVRQGEVLGIIGKNGAGKSTLLKILSQVTTPTRGQIRIRGRVASLLEVGTGFHPELSGLENVFLNGAILGMSKQEIRCKLDEIVAFAEIERFVDTPVKRYSSGMYVRLAFSVAAHLDPEILIVDEVLAVGDAAFRAKCLNKMQDVASEGRTILFVSHNISRIRRLCSRALWLESGRLKQCGEVHDVTLAYEQDVSTGTKSGNGVFIRSGSHHASVWLSQIEMRNGTGELTAAFKSGQSMILDMHLSYAENFSTTGLKDLSLVWILKDGGGVRISADEMLHHEIFFNQGDAIVRCTIDALPLYKGSYKFEFGVTSQSLGRLDTWLDEVGFDVLYCSPYDHGHERDMRSGFVHIGSRWELTD